MIRKTFLLSVVGVVGVLSARSEIAVDGKVPAGNVIVKGVEGDVVRLSQDLRDSNNWFYWAFRVTGAEGRTVRFDFVGPSDPVSCRGPAVTKDGGRTWAYAAEGHATPSNFVYAFAKDEKEVWFYQTFQYCPRQWDEFLARHAADRGKVFETGVLCKSRKGRDVPKARFGRIDGQARYRVWLSSRTHCGEAPATYVVEGWLERVFGKDALGAWLRENVEFMVVPFVDFDGVTDGDQGKGRKPHDHNRDYRAFLYPESKAIAEWVTATGRDRMDLCFDCHSPWVRNRHNEKVYQTYHADEWNTAAKIRWGRLLEKRQTGSMNYSVTGDFPWKFGWNGPKNTASSVKGAPPLVGLGGWLGENCPNLLMNSTYEIPFANANGRTVTPQSCREFGSASAETLKDFIEAMRPAVREGVVYRGNGDTPDGWAWINAAPKAKNWKVSFDYAFLADASRAFAFKLAFGDRTNPDVRTLFVDERGSHFGYAPTAKPKDGTPGFLPKGSHNWNKGAVVVKDGKAAFWTYRSGRLVKECEASFPALPLVGWSSGSAADKGGEVRLGRIVVTDACARPYDRGDPTEWLGQSPVATRFQWDEYWGRPVSVQAPLEVDFTRESVEIRARFVDKVSGISIAFDSATGTVARVSLAPDGYVFTHATREAKDGVFVDKSEKVKLADVRFKVRGTGVRDREYVESRPCLCDSVRWRQREVNEIYASYDRLRTLKDLAWAFDVKHVGANRYRVFLNENVLAEFDAPAPVVSVGVESKTAEIHGWAAKDAQAGKDAQTYELPMPPGGIALDAITGAYLFNVPKRQWVRAKAVCRVDPSAPTNALPVVTARLTGCCANGGRSVCEKTVDLRDPKAPVVKKGEDYEVTFDLDDVGLRDPVFEFCALSEPDPSSLRVFSGSLEAAPVR